VYRSALRRQTSDVWLDEVVGSGFADGLWWSSAEEVSLIHHTAKQPADFSALLIETLSLLRSQVVAVGCCVTLRTGYKPGGFSGNA